jgi:hypothetical protein
MAPLLYVMPSILEFHLTQSEGYLSTMGMQTRINEMKKAPPAENE